VVAYTLTRGGPLVGILAVFDAIGAAILLVVLWRGSLELLPWALATGGGAYAGTLYLAGRHTDQAVPLIAAGLLLCSELAAWSLDARWRVTAEAAVLRRRALALGALVGAGIVGSGAVIVFSGAAVGSGLVLTTLGAAAAVAAVGAGVALLVRGR
jgi:hypothetical protein